MATNHASRSYDSNMQHALMQHSLAAWLWLGQLAVHPRARTRAYKHQRGSRRVQQTVRRWRVSLGCSLLGMVREGVLLSTQGQVVSTNTEVLCLYARARSRIVRRIAAA